MHKKLLCVPLLVIALTLRATPESTPKLILVMSPDQFRYDYRDVIRGKNLTVDIVVYALKPYSYEDGNSTGAEHGSPYDYDAHVPLLLTGSGIHPGTYATEASPADIAPTLSTLLGIEFPAGHQGRVLIEALKLP